MGSPLSGITVVSFEQAVSAPYCTRMLADLGARVIKVERPDGGDFTRAYDDKAGGLSTYFVWANRNKESFSLDARDGAGAAIVPALLDIADIVVQNLAPGAASRLGIDAQTLVADRPHLIAVDIAGYGSDGPHAQRRAYDLLIQAESGSCAATGWPSHPAKPGVAVADVGTGLTAAVAILAALQGRHRTGEGAAIEISMFDVAADLLGPTLLYALMTGTERPPNGMSSPAVAPYAGYPTRDGQTVVLGTTNDAEWQRLTLDLIGRPDLAADPAYATNEQRCELRARIDEQIASWTLDRDAAQVCKLADEAGIGNAVYRTVLEATTHPEIEERGRWGQVGSPVGALPSLRTPVRTATWPELMRPVPDLGEHTTAILDELAAGTPREDGA
jgi:crotonobetainyl-CoA:carnitine CoA-transferase CaiB-like acyl-CoA transferase